MKYKKKRSIGSLFIILAMLFSLNVAVFAADGTVDLSAVGSISVTPKSNGKAVGAGMSFTLYQVGKADTAKDGTLSWVLTDEFSESKASLDDLEAADLAQTLSDHAEGNKISGDLQKVDEEGTVRFDGLSVGVYLLAQAGTENSDYSVDPFLVTVPLFEDGIAKYDVDATPKTNLMKLTEISVKKVWNDGGKTNSRPSSISVSLYRGKKVVDTVILNAKNSWKYTWKSLPESDAYTVKEKTVSGYTASYSKKGNSFTITNTKGSTTTGKKGSSGGSGSKLAQTGQLNWPIPVLAGCGIVLFAFGWGLVFLRKKNEKAE